MIHKLSLSTTYLQLFYIHPGTGERALRSYASGFFTYYKNELWLVTNWHVFSGINPAEPNSVSKPPPNYITMTIIGDNKLYEITTPLYDMDMQPIWLEHEEGYKVDLALLPIPPAATEHFNFVDINESADHANIQSEIAKDAFILGYPFSKDEIRQEFGEDTSYFLPIWKRASIATEPAVPLQGRIILLDSLSRPGMSGAPVLISQDEPALTTSNKDSFNAMQRLLKGDTSAILDLDHNDLNHTQIKKYKLLGVYSGVIGNTRLSEVALGKCWTVETLMEALSNPKLGHMPSNQPIKNEFYTKFLNEAQGQLVIRDRDGNTTEAIDLN